MSLDNQSYNAFQAMLDDVEARAKKDLGTAVVFRDLLEDIAGYLNNIEQHTCRQVRVIDLVVILLLVLNLLTTIAVYAMIRM